jgi:hypothetical protein
MDEFAVEILSAVIGGVGVLASVVFGVISYVQRRKAMSGVDSLPEPPVELEAGSPAPRKSFARVRFIEW